MPDYPPFLEEIKAELQNLKGQVLLLQVEFRYFRNIIVTLYLTVVAPLVVTVLMGIINE